MLKPHEINTQRQVKAILLKADLPELSDKSLTVLGKVDNSRLKEALCAIENGHDLNGTYREYIASQMILLTQPVIAKLASLGLSDVQLELLVALGNKCGQEFKDYLSKAALGDAASLNWILKRLGRALVKAKPLSFHSISTPSESGVIAMSGQNGLHEMTYSGNDHIIKFKQFVNQHCNNILVTIESLGDEKWTSEGFELTEKELLAIATVLMGRSRTCELRNLGPNRKSNLIIEKQKSRIFIHVHDSNISRSLVTEGFAGFSLLSLVCRQIQLNHPHLSEQMVITLLQKIMDESEVSN